MKKLYTTPEFKAIHIRRLKKIQRAVRKKKFSIETRIRCGQPKIKVQKKVTDIKSVVVAPSDLRLIENTEECLIFFRKLRSNEYLSRKNNNRFVITSLKNVTQIDYGSISILTSINDDLKCKKIILKGDLPLNSDCAKFMIESGYLNNLFDNKGKAFPKVDKSDLIFFEKGRGYLTLNDNIRISNTVKHVVQHLTGELSQCLAVKSILLEICGNSIEWGGTDNNQWLLGVKYESNKVIFTVTDVGNGILDTLHKKFRLKLADIFTRKSSDEILKGAFEQKYGSSTQEVNRNKGLPAVKHNFEQDIIQNLKVLTNNVILHFDNEQKSKTFKKGSARFKGTMYQWEMTKECIDKIKIS